MRSEKAVVGICWYLLVSIDKLNVNAANNSSLVLRDTVLGVGRAGLEGINSKYQK